MCLVFFDFDNFFKPSVNVKFVVNKLLIIMQIISASLVFFNLYLAIECPLIVAAAGFLSCYLNGP